MKKLNLKGMAAAAMITGTLGCAGDSSSTGGVTTNFVMTGSSSNATVAKTNLERWIQSLIPMAYAAVPSSIVDSGGNIISLTDAWVVIKEIKFKATETADESEDSEESEFKGPYYVDLLDPNPAPLDTQALPDVTYKRIRMKFDNNCGAELPAGAPAELDTNSMVFKGSVDTATPSSAKNFSFLMDDGVELEISGAGGIAASNNQNLLVSVQIANIAKQIDLYSKITDGDAISSSNRINASNPCPNIDASASDLYTCFKKGFEQQAKLGKDEDGDGELEAEEDSVED